MSGCEHEWSERGSGVGFRWRECWLCGEMSDYLPDAGEALALVQRRWADHVEEDVFDTSATEVPRHPTTRQPRGHR